MGATDSGVSAEVRVVEGASLNEALLAVPNDPKLVKLIQQGEPGHPEGRSGALYKLAAQLGELGVSPENAKTIIAYADSRWGKFLKRKDGQLRIDQLLDKFFDSKPASLLQGLVPVHANKLKDIAPEADWIIDGLLLRKTYAIITGGTGVGKSQLGMQLARAFAKGEMWDNYQLEKSRVLYGSHEMNVGEIQEFNKKLELAMPLEDDDVFDFVPAGFTISLLTEEGRSFYLQYIDQYDVFFFDTASSSTHLAMLDERSGIGLVEFFNTLIAHGKTVIILGHDTKEAARNGHNRAEDGYGHRLLIDRASLIIRVSKWGDSKEHVTVGFPKVRLGKEPPTTVYARNEQTLWLTRTTYDPHDKVQGKIVTDEAEALLAATDYLNEGKKRSEERRKGNTHEF